MNCQLVDIIKTFENFSMRTFRGSLTTVVEHLGDKDITVTTYVSSHVIMIEKYSKTRKIFLNLHNTYYAVNLLKGHLE